MGMDVVAPHATMNEEMMNSMLESYLQSFT